MWHPCSCWSCGIPAPPGRLRGIPAPPGGLRGIPAPVDKVTSLLLLIKWHPCCSCRVMRHPCSLPVNEASLLLFNIPVLTVLYFLQHPGFNSSVLSAQTMEQGRLTSMCMTLTSPRDEVYDSFTHPGFMTVLHFYDSFAQNPTVLPGLRKNLKLLIRVRLTFGGPSRSLDISKSLRN